MFKSQSKNSKVFTDTFVRTVKAPPRKADGTVTQVDYWDSSVDCFGLRVSSSGQKTWIVAVRVLRAGKRFSTRTALGTYPELSLTEARTRAREAVRLARTNRDPRELLRQENSDAEEQSRNTFGHLVEEFLRTYVAGQKQLKPKTRREYERALKGEDTSPWGARPVTEITKRNVLDLLDAVNDRGTPIWANRLLAYLRRFFGWCVERDILAAAPTGKIRGPAKENRIERALSSAEIVEVWEAAAELGGLFGPIHMILLLTGQRREEVAGMRWEELHGLDTDTPQWDLPGTRTKNHLPHVVPLAPQVVEILKGLPRITASPFVFSKTGNTSVSGFSKARVRVDEILAQRRTNAKVKGAMPPWRLHDLRRTVSTRLHEDLGEAPWIVEAILNHISGHRAGVAGTYNRALYLEDKRRALTAWANHVERLVEGGAERSNIVPFRAAGNGSRGGA